jgi:hypothetical protein
MRRALGALLLQQARYLRLALVPAVWAVVPVAILLAHLQAHYGYDGLRPASQTLVSVRLTPGVVAGARRPALSLEAPPGVRVETPCVWTPALREGAWRVVADRPGEYELRLVANGVSETKRLAVSAAVITRAPRRPTDEIWDVFLNPAEPPLPSRSPIESIEVRYPPRAINVFGISMPWIVVFLVLTTVFMLAGRPIVNVVL